MIDYPHLSPAEVVELAKDDHVTDVGQLTRQQRAALGRAVRRGELARYWDPFFGRKRIYASPPPWTSNPA